LESKRRLVDELFAEWDRSDSPGCVLGIIWNGRFIHARGYGMANLEYDVPITTKTVFRIASVSKQFTAACIALLVERGKLSLNDDVRIYIPELPKYDHPVRVKHLIYHVSGIRDYLELMSLTGRSDDDYYTAEDVLELLSKQKTLNFNPGERFLYSNSNYFLLGLIVERISGISLRRFADENIFKPLGMLNTHFHDDHTMIVKNRAVGYSPRKGGGFRIDETNLDIVGDGGIFTTVEDLYIWDQNFYDNKLEGGRRLIERMLTAGTLKNGEKINYAFGLRIGSYRGLRIIYHSGSFAGFRTQLMRFPKFKFTIICLANSSSINPTRLSKRIADIYLAEHLGGVDESKFIKLPLEKLKVRVGVFRGEDGFTCKTYIENNELVLEFLGRRIRLKPLSENQFKSVNSPIDFNVEFGDCNGKSSTLTLRIEDGKPEIFKAVKQVSPILSMLKEYVGEYFSEELETVYSLILRKSKLYFKYRNAPKEPLKPTVKDEFTVDSMSIQFMRKNGGRIVGFILNSRRAKHIYFKRIIGKDFAA